MKRKLKVFGIILIGFVFYFGLGLCMRQFIHNSVILTLVVDAIMIGLLLVFQKFTEIPVFLNESTTALGVGIFAGVFALVYIADVVISNYVYRYLPHASVDHYQASMAKSSVAEMILLTVIVAPIVEELFFRQFLYGQLKRICHPFAAIVISSLVFALLHGTTIHLFTALISGMLFAFIYEYFQSIDISILGHVAVNAFTLATSNVLYPNWLFTIPVFIILLVLLLFSFVILYILCFDSKVD